MILRWFHLPVLLLVSLSHELQGVHSVRFSIALPSPVRLLEMEGCHFSKYAVLGFLLSIANVPAVSEHGSVHLGRGGGC
jgi:hypothetical protein